MKLEDQVISLELAKRLKELGVKQESLFVWYIKMVIPVVIYLPTVARNKEDDETASAFTVAEILSVIEPSANEWSCGYNDSGCFYHFRKGNRGSGNMIDGCHQKESEFTAEENFTDSLAMWLIHLIEKGIVKPEGREGK